MNIISSILPLPRILFYNNLLKREIFDNKRKITKILLLFYLLCQMSREISVHSKTIHSVFLKDGSQVIVT